MLGKLIFFAILSVLAFAAGSAAISLIKSGKAE